MTHFHAGHNTPGYSPEADVETFSTFADAKAFQIAELDRAGDHIFEAGEDEDERGIADSYSAEMEDLNLSSGSEWSAHLPTSTSEHDLGISYWINQCEEVDCLARTCVHCGESITPVEGEDDEWTTDYTDDHGKVCPVADDGHEPKEDVFA